MGNKTRPEHPRSDTIEELSHYRDIGQATERTQGELQAECNAQQQSPANRGGGEAVSSLTREAKHPSPQAH